MTNLEMILKEFEKDKPELGIVNDADRPCARLIVVKCEDGLCRYIFNPEYWPLDSSKFTPLEDFGLVTKINRTNSLPILEVLLKPNSISKATYSTGQQRTWQERAHYVAWFVGINPKSFNEELIFPIKNFLEWC